MREYIGAGLVLALILGFLFMDSCDRQEETKWISGLVVSSPEDPKELSIIGNVQVGLGKSGTLRWRYTDKVE